MTDEKNYDALAEASVAKAIKNSDLVKVVALTLKYFDDPDLTEKKREFLAADVRIRIMNIIENSVMRLSPDWDEENALSEFDPAMFREVPGIAELVAKCLEQNDIGDDEDEDEEAAA